MIPYFFFWKGMYRKHPNHTYGRNRNNSANNWAIVPTVFWYPRTKDVWPKIKTWFIGQYFQYEFYSCPVDLHNIVKEKKMKMQLQIFLIPLCNLTDTLIQILTVSKNGRCKPKNLPPLSIIGGPEKLVSKVWSWKQYHLF